MIITCMKAEARWGCYVLPPKNPAEKDLELNSGIEPALCTKQFFCYRSSIGVHIAQTKDSSSVPGRSSAIDTFWLCAKTHNGLEAGVA